jgi:hypothetical protein
MAGCDPVLLERSNVRSVAALLNDLFGVQSRSGCMCAGPYIQRILGLNLEQVSSSERFGRAISGCIS